MKNVVITGSARGFGYAMAECFAKEGLNVVLSDINQVQLEESRKKLQEKYPDVKILAFPVDVTNVETIKLLINNTIQQLQTIDYWINNAGVNQPNKQIWALEDKDINRLIDIDLKGTILCSKEIMKVMITQKSGQIYNVEGYGSDNATMLGLSIYGTSKRAVTYFTEALATENDTLNTGIQIGKITPGIMITNFITTSLGNGEKIELDEKTKKVYNILGDYPETIAEFTVPRILKNKSNYAKIMWLTPFRAAIRFITSPFNKRDFFR